MAKFIKLRYIFQKRLLIVALCFIFPLTSSAQSILTKVPPPEGVDWGGISCFTQDESGFLWLATYNGLYRFDGYKFTAFYHSPEDPNTVASDVIFFVYWSSRGYLWIGTEGKGLDRYDPLEGRFAHYVHDPQNPQSISSNTVFSIYEDRDGYIWVGTENGLNRLDVSQNKFDRFQHYPNDPNSLAHNEVRAIYQDKEGEIWVGTGKTSSWANEGGLNKFLPKSGNFKRYQHDENDPFSLINNKVRTISEDSRGNLWIGTSGDGLHLFDKSSEKFRRFTHDPSQPEKLSRAPIFLNHPIEGVSFVHEDITGAIWIGSFGGGVSRYDTLAKKVEHFVGGSHLSGGLDDNKVRYALTTKEGVLWFSTLEGNLYRTDPQQLKLGFQRTDEHVRFVYEDKSRRLWVARPFLNFFDFSDGITRSSDFGERLPLQMKKETFRAIIEDKQGKIWLGGPKGLWEFDPATYEYSLYTHDPNDPGSIPNGEILALYMDSSGFIWIGTEMGGVGRFDPKEESCFTYHHNPNHPNGINWDKVRVFQEDGQGNIWMGAWDRRGLNKLNIKTGEFSHYLSGSHSISAMLLDNEGKLWVGTWPKGLFWYDPAKDKFVKYTEPITGEEVSASIRGMVEDELGNIWVSTSAGLIKLDRETGHFSSYGQEVGFYPSEFNLLAASKNSRNHVFIGESNGFYYFDSRQFSPNQHAPQLAWIDFRLFDQPIKPGKDSPLSKPLRLTKEIELSHNQNSFSFDFAGIHYTKPQRNQHQYFLEGYDVDWRLAGENITAAYYKVPPGKYNLKVRAASSEGIWEEKEMAIIIHPPWWLSTYAYIGYGMAVILMLWLWRKYTINQQRLKHELVLQRMEAEKMHEVDHLKSMFFANISHEFRTPLTLILSPMDGIIRETPKSDPKKRVFKIIKSNAQNLLHLINQLLDLSKIESGSMEIKTQPIETVQFVKKTLSAFWPFAQKKDIHFNSFLPKDDKTLYIDSEKLERILSNLLSNAFKFTPEGGKIKVELEWKTLDEWDKKPKGLDISKAILFQFRISDSGVGLSENDQKRIFDRFFQVDNSPTRDQQGTGIGLSLVKELTELHRGEIHVCSKLGEGTQFTITIPYQLAEVHHGKVNEENTLSEEIEVFEDGETMVGPTSPGENEIKREAAKREQPLVLIVEDNAELREYIFCCIEKNFSVVMAENGKEGREKAQSYIPDLVLSDIMMPIMDGVELCKLLKSDDKTAHIPVILLTAKASGGDKLNALKLGADDYLVKPFNPNELLARIDNLIESRRLLREKFEKHISFGPDEITMPSADANFLSKLTETIQSNFENEDFTTESLGLIMGMSRTQLFRKTKAVTNLSPGEFIRILRLKRAAQLFEKGVSNIAEVGYMVGFHDPSYFTKSFRKHFGKNPSEFMAERQNS